MAENQDNNGQVKELSNEILREIFMELQGFRREVKEEIGALRAEMNEKITATNKRLGRLKREVKKGFACVNLRLDSIDARVGEVASFSGESYRDLKQRVQS